MLFIIWHNFVPGFPAFCCEGCLFSVLVISVTLTKSSIEKRGFALAMGLDKQRSSWQGRCGMVASAESWLITFHLHTGSRAGI